MTFCQSPHRDDVIRLLCTYPEVRRTLTSRKCALTPGTQQPRNVAVGPTTDQMSAEAAFTIVRALGVRTVTGGELHGSLLMQTVCCASGVYRERSRRSLIRIHTRYRGTAPSRFRRHSLQDEQATSGGERDGFGAAGCAQLE